MAGHSHWAGIKHKKALVDNKRGKLWSKLSKQIIVAAKMGGGDPEANARLRTAIADAKAVSLPKDNIARAIKKGTGELDGGNVEEVIYEGYGPAGVAVMCDIMTDNRNRTAPEVRKLFEIHGGKLGATNCVAWMFDRKGLFVFAANGTDEEKLMEIALEAGAEDVRQVADKFEVTCDPDAYSQVTDALETAEIEPDVKEITRIPNNTVDLDASQARKVLKLMEALDDHDDVQNVSANFNISDEVIAEIGEE
ncbi:MAG: YebC/PmpR family DNA-binding transcriptional regulator [Planctomycetes bacterium]|nr:YebC/PmpR family DNA-binding transcriptional regulator [Planctomycetota bacterium]MBL7038110.1 YebC/PmpR family DNA-binding transcriptional regulator [Pirellulaceae bacterium]